MTVLAGSLQAMAGMLLLLGKELTNKKGNVKETLPPHFGRLVKVAYV